MNRDSYTRALKSCAGKTIESVEDRVVGGSHHGAVLTFTDGETLVIQGEDGEGYQAWIETWFGEVRGGGETE